MNPVARWWRFNLVGAIGMGVQLGALAVLNRAMTPHYLVATTLALEITLLHNFAWHVAYTWRDRCDPQGLKPADFERGLAARLKSCPDTKPLGLSARLKSCPVTKPLGLSARLKSCPDAAPETIAGRLVRFHLTNGLVSLIGNLALMRLLVQGAHVPVLAANGIAILCCSILNFLLADRWAFVQSFGNGSPGNHPAGAEAQVLCLRQSAGLKSRPYASCSIRSEFFTKL